MFAKITVGGRSAGLRFGSLHGCDCGRATLRNTAAIPATAKLTKGPIAEIAAVRFQLVGRGGWLSSKILTPQIGNSTIARGATPERLSSKMYASSCRMIEPKMMAASAVPRHGVGLKCAAC